MLNYEKKGSFTDSAGYLWEYYQDDTNLSIFYVVPRPDWVINDAGDPEIKLVKYQTDKPTTNGSGYVIFNTQLTVSPEAESGVQGQIAVQFPNAPKPYQLNPMDFNAGCTAEFTLDVQGSETTYSATASEFGANVASFRADLDADGMKTISGLLSTAGGGLNVTYNLNVQARLNAVTATLSFNSAIAYQYQVQHAQHHAYAADTPRVVTKLLQESASSNVDLKWGIQNPPQTLVQSVTDWANATIASQVSAEVQTALSMLNEQSYDSFRINEVSSFTSVYETDQVINWKIYPKAALPNVSNLTNFTSTVDTREQVMVVSVNLPFEGEKVKGANVPKIDAKPVLLKQVTVQVDYPGLSQANSTYVFKANGSHTFSAPFDTSHGEAYNVTWTAEYVDSAAQPAVTGQALNVTQGNYGIELPTVGILNVTFEARNAFAKLKAGGGATKPPKVTSLDIDFHFASNHAGGDSIHQKQTIDAPTSGSKSDTEAVFTSYVAHNVVTGTAYSYVVTYHFEEGPDFVTPAISSTSYNEIIATPPAPHPTSILIVAAVKDTTEGGGKEPTVIEADVDVWFDTDETIPGAGPQPTKSNPTPFKLVPKTKDGVIFVSDTFFGFLNGSIPLAYSATINTMMGTQVTIPPTRIQNLQPSIMINPNTRYTTIEVDMSAVDWSTNPYDKIVVSVNGSVPGKGGKSTPIGSTASFDFVPLSDKSAHNAPRYVTYTHSSDQDVINFTWEVLYIQSGVGTTKANGSGSSKVPTIVVPPKGSSSVTPPPKPLTPVSVKEPEMAK